MDQTFKSIGEVVEDTMTVVKNCTAALSKYDVDVFWTYDFWGVPVVTIHSPNGQFRFWRDALVGHPYDVIAPEHPLLRQPKDSSLTINGATKVVIGLKSIGHIKAGLLSERTAVCHPYCHESNVMRVSGRYREAVAEEDIITLTHHALGLDRKFLLYWQCWPAPAECPLSNRCPFTERSQHNHRVRESGDMIKSRMVEEFSVYKCLKEANNLEGAQVPPWIYDMERDAEHL